ncbi:MAG: hypothetical protein WCQ99_08240, partial [Pseudomonadota bacterium]
MAVQPSDFFKNHLTRASSLGKPTHRDVQTAKTGVKKGFAAVLNQVQSTAGGITHVGKNCLTTVNPLPHLASLYKLAQTAIMSKTDPSDNEMTSWADTDTGLSSNCLSEAADIVAAPPESISTGDESAAAVSGAGRQENQLGGIAAKYESGGQGIEAVGYDRTGGTSYGTYQISSKAGTLSRFIEYLQENAPEWAKRLQAAGPANTGSTSGRMPREWKKIAAEDPARFEKLQYDFIKDSHYKEALSQINSDKEFNISKRSAALKEALWSTAVQHGAKGAADIFGRAIDRLQKQGAEVTDKKLIDEIYSSRAKYFRSSTRRVRYSVQQRFNQEKMVVLAMLK